MAYIDVMNLKAENIRKNFDGKLWIMTKRIKTNVKVNVPLMDIPKMILDKYAGQLPQGKLLPVISNQKMNAYLKEIGDVCGMLVVFPLPGHAVKIVYPRASRYACR